MLPFDSLWSARNNFRLTSRIFICLHNIAALHTYENAVNQMQSLTRARFPVQMSEAPMSVLNCNGPCQIKRKAFFLCPPSDSINTPSGMNSQATLDLSQIIRVCVCRHSIDISGLCYNTYYNNHPFCSFSSKIKESAHIYEACLCQSGWETSRRIFCAKVAAGKEAKGKKMGDTPKV